MFKKSEKGYYFWEEFAAIDGLVHGFSTRRFGDMNWKNQNSIKNLRLFCDALQIKPNQIVRMEQVHGNNVEIVDYRTSHFRHSGNQASPGARRYLASPEHPESEILKQVQNDNRDSGQARMTWVASADGLISSQKNVFLLATFADCVPILFLDKDKKIFGIAHAGWKGVYKEIVNVLVSKMGDRGCDPKKIIVGLGPSIRVCCYDVYKSRVEIFKKKFSKMKGIIEIKDHKTFLDLIKIVKLQLKGCGILDQNILDCKLCTKENMSDFYSYRGEHGKSSFGLSAAVIGRI